MNINDNLIVGDKVYKSKEEIVADLELLKLLKNILTREDAYIKLRKTGLVTFDVTAWITPQEVLKLAALLNVTETNDLDTTEIHFENGVPQI